MRYNVEMLTHIKHLLLSFYIILLSFPLITLYFTSGGIDGITSQFTNFQTATYFLLRLVGLYAFVLLFIQLMVGAFMFEVRRIFGSKMLAFHITQGITIYILIFLHPTLYVLFNIESNGFLQGLYSLLPKFVQSELYYNLGRTAFLLFTVGIFAGLFRTRPYLLKHWRKLHSLNYIAFGLIIIHSGGVGSDTSTFPMNMMYPLSWLGLSAAFTHRKILPLFHRHRHRFVEFYHKHIRRRKGKKYSVR